jgi:hypothetical protein
MREECCTDEVKGYGKVRKKLNRYSIFGNKGRWAPVWKLLYSSQ